MPNNLKHSSDSTIYHLESSGSMSDEIIDFLNAINVQKSTTLGKWLTDLLMVLNFPLTVIYESYYVDKVYRDEYYRYYSRMHFQVSRNCKRLIFINNTYSEKDLLSSNNCKHMEIETNLIGMVVIKPNMLIGRTIINPNKLKINSCYLRTTNFSFTVYGHVYKIPAFPISGQDTDVMTCAEVNVWSIMEYFGTRYKEYRTILPSDLLETVKDYVEERQLPSEGLTPEQESLIFIKNGLYSRIYYNFEEEPYNGRVVDHESASLEDVLSLYIESGIPVLLNLRQKKSAYTDNYATENTITNSDNHCVTCIGHEHVEFDVKSIKQRLDRVKPSSYNDGISYYPSCRLYESFIFMEDHSIPYQTSPIKELTFNINNNESQWEIDSMVVPLYKHLFVSAEMAFAIVKGIFDDTNDVIRKHFGKKKSKSKRIVFRLFLTSSRNYKEFRITSTNRLTEKKFYEQCVFPKLIWVCEYYMQESYCAKMGDGEFVIDATSSKLDETPSTILIRHASDVFIREPENSDDTIGELKENILDDSFKMYIDKNLDKIEGKENQ